MKQIQLKNSTTIVLKPMDESFILPAGKGRCPVNCDMRIGGELVPTENFRVLNEKMIERYGTTAILAIDNNLVIGFVNFYPTWCPHFDLCQDEQIDEAMDHLDEIDNPSSCDDPALHVRCLMVRHQYRGNNLAVGLLEYLKEWAKANGWRKIVGNGCIFSGKAQYQWLVSPKPPKPIWENAGFVVGDYSDWAKAESSPEATQQAREWYRSGAFPQFVPRDVDPDDPNWYEIFKGYTMICEL